MTDKEHKPLVTIIAAVSENGVIGRGGGLPWHLSDDLKHFKKLTTGHTVIMGRRTFESFGARPLPNRRNIIITRNKKYSPEGVEVAASFDDALSLSSDDDEVFVCGGQQVYEQAIPLAGRMYLSHVEAIIEGGDTFFPEYESDNWQLCDEWRHEPDDLNDYAFAVRWYERKS